MPFTSFGGVLDCTSTRLSTSGARPRSAAGRSSSPAQCRCPAPPVRAGIRRNRLLRRDDVSVLPARAAEAALEHDARRHLQLGAIRPLPRVGCPNPRSRLPPDEGGFDLQMVDCSRRDGWPDLRVGDGRPQQPGQLERGEVRPQPELPAAGQGHWPGAHLPGHEVTSIGHDGKRYVVHARKISPTGEVLRTRTLTADKLILAAGSVGTSELLVKGKASGFAGPSQRTHRPRVGHQRRCRAGARCHGH